MYFIEKLLNEDCWIMHLGEGMAFEILWMDLLHILLKTELRMHLGKGKALEIYFFYFSRVTGLGWDYNGRGE